MPSQNQITPETLQTRIGAPDAPVLIDICIDQDFALDPRLIPGASRYPFAQIEQLAPNLSGREVVVICQKGLKLSEGAAAILRANGVDARPLRGGMVAWAGLALPAIPATALPNIRLATPEGPTSDSLAAIWLIKRFALKEAKVMFVTADTCEAVADRYGATVLKGYSTLLKDFQLNQKPLHQIKDVLGDRKTDLAKILAGLRSLHSDDLGYVAASLPLFDALFRAFSDASDDAADSGATA